ncbi:hypothetical protein FRB94_006022 [Tulasnella sp. JGI-2019a]|nr:hypothetical protein FRB93_005930 [Tulasnella sp. JGI-2019a]KAG8999599.1 hypothetical protein FRB94_006022 [Tulasnella sp. JGI-2019a]KAG9028935.1 hypothetical protein FRB95_005887 [Tulasnella sp. JGI-2019a]
MIIQRSESRIYDRYMQCISRLLAETIHLIPTEHWPDGYGCEAKGFVEVFVRVMNRQVVGETSRISPTGIWNRDDGVVAVVLFLRAWDRVSFPSSGGLTACKCSASWTSPATIKAFMVWLGGYHAAQL